MSISSRVSPLTPVGRVLLLGALFLLLATPAAFAQSATAGAVVGTVSDPSGAVIQRAEVQLSNTETNATQTQTTNDIGAYAFPNVAPGKYKVTVKMAGFRTTSISDL